MFALSLVSLFGYHIYLVALNRTTLGKTLFRISGLRHDFAHLLIYEILKISFCDNTQNYTYETFAEAFRTPIFRIGGPDKNGFNLGRYNNIQEVFGDDKRLWLVPVFTR